MKPLTLTDSQSRRLLAGEQVEMRRAVKPGDPSWTYSTIDDSCGPLWLWDADECGDWHRAPGPWAPGDVLWVREACRAEELEDGTDVVRYRADDECVVIENTEAASERWCNLLVVTELRHRGWIPARSMPRWACRMYARCIEVRVDCSGTVPEWIGVFERAAHAAERKEP